MLDKYFYSFSQLIKDLSSFAAFNLMIRFDLLEQTFELDISYWIVHNEINSIPEKRKYLKISS